MPRPDALTRAHQLLARRGRHQAGRLARCAERLLAAARGTADHAAALAFALDARHYGGPYHVMRALLDEAMQLDAAAMPAGVRHRIALGRAHFLMMSGFRPAALQALAELSRDPALAPAEQREVERLQASALVSSGELAQARELALASLRRHDRDAGAFAVFQRAFLHMVLSVALVRGDAASIETPRHAHLALRLSVRARSAPLATMAASNLLHWLETPGRAARRVGGRLPAGLPHAAPCAPRDAGGRPPAHQRRQRLPGARPAARGPCRRARGLARLLRARRAVAHRNDVPGAGGGVRRGRRRGLARRAA